MDELIEKKLALDILGKLSTNIICAIAPVDVYTHAKADLKILFQMFSLKTMSLRRQIEEFSFHSDEFRINPIIDYATAFSIVRGLYEAFCIFELIYIIPKNEEQTNILHALFRVAGLNERQDFNISSDEGQQILQEEKEEINQIKTYIESTELYRGASLSFHNHIQSAIISRNYRYVFMDNGDIKKYGWDQIKDLIEAKVPVLDDMYKFLSLYEHPSSLSIRQFSEAFSKDGREFVKMAAIACDFSVLLMAMYLADLNTIYPEVKQEFMKLSETERRIIDGHNFGMRGKERTICPEDWQNVI